MSDTLFIEKLGGNGVCISRLNGKVVFIPLAVPGDRLTAKIIEEKKSFIKAEIDTIVESSLFRTKPPCPYFGVCGGCAHQNILYEKQCEFKTGLLEEIFRKAKGSEAEFQAVTPSPDIFGYRNKIHLQVVNKAGSIAIGFFKVNSNEIVEIDSCLLCRAKINALFKKVKELILKHWQDAGKNSKEEPALKDIVIQESGFNGDLQITFIVGVNTIAFLEPIIEGLKDFPGLKGIFTYYNPSISSIAFKDAAFIDVKSSGSLLKTVHGHYIMEKFSNINFTISPVSFFQVNTGQAAQIIRLIRNILLQVTFDKSCMIDGYAGIGTLSLPLADCFQKVLAIELVRSSMELARTNSRLNGISNYTVKAGDTALIVKNLIKQSGASFEKDYPVLLLDPPRAGLSVELVDLMIEHTFKLIFYLSCDPHTQSRDVNRILQNPGYDVSGIYGFDMFPHTFHIENLVIIKKRGT